MDDEIRHPLAHARHERGWSQEELARRIRQAAERRGLRSGTRGSRVYKWETNRATPDEDESQPLIAEVLGIDYTAVAHLGWPHWLPGQETPMPLGQHNTVPSLREALMTSLDRRSILAYTSSALAAFAQQWATTSPAQALPAPADRHIDPDLVTWLETTGAQLTSLATEQRQHTRLLLDALLTTVTDLIEAGHHTQPLRQRLHTLAASLAQTAAWQRFDARKHAAAGRFWHAALHNAHTAAQHDLGAGILSDLAYQALWLNDPHTATAILDHAIPHTQHPTARSLLHLRNARAQAALGEATACRRSLTAAEQALNTHSADPTPAWCSWMSPADLSVDSGRCLAELGDHHRAHRLIDEGIAALPTSRNKTRAVFLTYEAENHLRTGDPEQAAAAAAASLSLARHISAPRCITMVRDLEPHFAPHSTAPGVPDLLETLRTTG